MINSVQDNTFSFLSQTIFCRKHNTPAKSICLKCKVYFCLNPTCGQEHIYHDVESLDLLLNNQIFPFLRNYLDMSKQDESSSNMHTKLNMFQNNLKNFAVQEKMKLDDYYKKIQNLLHLIYNSYLEDINEFIEALSIRFECLQSRVVTKNDCKFF
jgi:lantibiotic modifying enzyme